MKKVLPISGQPPIIEQVQGTRLELVVAGGFSYALMDMIYRIAPRIVKQKQTAFYRLSAFVLYSMLHSPVGTFSVYIMMIF